MEILKQLERFELHHKVLSFLLIVALTILITRVAVSFHNPNPALVGFEIHHFDYGLSLLLVVSLLMLFGKGRYGINFILMGISFGLILDDLWFIRSNILDPSFNEMEIYSATLPSVIVLVVIVTLLAIVIDHTKRKRI